MAESGKRKWSDGENSIRMMLNKLNKVQPTDRCLEQDEPIGNLEVTVQILREKAKLMEVSSFILIYILHIIP